ncbi:MAG: hypothetical protein QXW38_08500 [Candidatus Nitrosotenuis sp.]
MATETEKAAEEIKVSEEVKEEVKALVKPQGAKPIVMPAVSAEQAKRAWEAYQELKQTVLDRGEDVQIIQGREFLKKSYWRKLATFFNLSVDVVEERSEKTDKGDTIYHFVCKATAPNGRYSIGSGSASVYEKGYRNTLHNARATAETRAFNRAVSNLVGGGEVSAEEVDQDQESEGKKVSRGVGQQTITGGKATENQRKAIFSLAKKAGMEADVIKNKVKERYGLGSFTDITFNQASEVIDDLQEFKGLPAT